MNEKRYAEVLKDIATAAIKRNHVFNVDCDIAYENGKPNVVVVNNRGDMANADIRVSGRTLTIEVLGDPGEYKVGFVCDQKGKSEVQ